MSSELSKWTTDDFESISWHDNYVHGWHLVAGDNTGGQLVLDLDYILEWLRPDANSFHWRIAPAHLMFHQVFQLRVEVDFATLGAAVGPCSVSGIGREVVPMPGGAPWYRWDIGLNWPEGHITFEAAGFTMRLRQPPCVRDHQCLSRQERAVDTW